MSDIKKYSGEIIRQAIATKLKSNETNCQINGSFQVGNNFEWDVYVDENSVNLLKFTSSVNSRMSSYNFTLNFGKLDSSYAKKAFAKLFDCESDTENICCNIDVQCNIYFVLRDGDKYNVLVWNSIQNIFKGSMGCNDNKTWTISLSKSDDKYSLRSSPFGSESNVTLKEYDPFSLSDIDYCAASQEVKKRKYNISDWQRLLDRSFEKYWKHVYDGQKGQLDKAKKKQEYEDDFKSKLSNENFNEKFFGAKITRSCVYCGIKEEQLSDLCKQSKRSGRGYRLEYDRINDHQDYEIDNVVLACYWCNNAKTDEFSPNEFKEIARGINKTWNRRLAHNKQQNDLEKAKWYIEFPEYAPIWENNHSYSVNGFCDKVEDDYLEEDDNE